MSFHSPGILLIDKPEGWTSHDVVAKVRRILRTKAVGHCGTLDPMATGLLILLLGDATKLSDHLLTQEKTYETRVKLGLTTDSLDMTGEVETSLDPEDLKSRLADKDISGVVAALSGEIELEIPIFSAKKVNGKKLYELAREGKPVVAPRKVMKFLNVEFLEQVENEVSARLSCEKGGFVRAWGKELGERLGVGGTLSQLRRTASFPWKVDDALTLEKLASLIESAEESSNEISLAVLGRSFVPINQCLPHLDFVCVDTGEQRLLSHGQIPHSLSAQLIAQRRSAVKDQRVIGIQIFDKTKSHLLALLQATPDRGLKIRKVFAK